MAAVQSLPWTDPLDMASAVGESHWVLLYSGIQTSTSGRYSYLAHDLAERIEGKDFSALAGRLDTDLPVFGNAWFGYLGYGLKDSLERLPQDSPSWPALPNLCMMRFHTIYQFDHQARRVLRWSDKANGAVLAPAVSSPADVPRVIRLRSNMTKAEYLDKAAQVIERVRAGDLYQANLTRKFMGDFEKAPDAFALFASLSRISPAAYSAYIHMGDTHILSSSPELFLKIAHDGEVTTRPIKGTSPRFSDPAADRASCEALVASAKDRAENLMIVDLMRNDLSKTCLPGSVDARNLFEVTSHATIHHMSSTVSGQQLPNYSTLDTVKQCFPPGSMTGAPKIRAMALCSELEKQARGVYSGAIGWFGGDGSCELSVVIRTLVMQGGAFEFQVGGGIVADSTPQAELQELLSKAKALATALCLAPTELENL